MPVLANLDDLGAVIAFQERAYDGNRAIKGVEPLPLQVDYRNIFARMELWIAGPRSHPNGIVILDLMHDPFGKELFLWSIATAPETRGTGLGNTLLTFVERRAQDLGRPFVSLVTNSRLSERISWYKRHGFNITHHEDLADRTVVGMRKAVGDSTEA